MKALKITREEILKMQWFFDWVQKAGIRFYTSALGNGCFDLNSNQLVRYLADQDQFWADKCEVSLEKWLFFCERMRDWQCTAMTAKDKRCKNPRYSTAYVETASCGNMICPKDFRPGFHDRCP